MADKRSFYEYERCRAGEHAFKLCFSSLPQAGLTTMPIVKLGTYYQGSTPVTISRDDLEHLVANFRKSENGSVPVNYDQVNEWPTVLQQGTLPTAGWLMKIDEAPDKDGVLWGQVELAGKARQLILNEGYKYLLPTLRYDLRDKEFNLQGMTLVALILVKNPPFLASPPTALSETAEDKTVFNSCAKLDRFLCDEAQTRMKASGISFSEAFDRLRRESPDLFELRQRLFLNRDRTGNVAAIDATLRDTENQIQAHIRSAMAQRAGLSYHQAYQLALSERPELFHVKRALQNRGALLT